ncbi:MAG: MG2 domain-containing protein, partial [Terracidiphilus sp.]
MILRRRDRSLRPARFVASILLFASAAALSLSQQPERGMVATYAHGSLAVTIPYHAEQAGAGNLIVEILDPEDHVLGRAEGEVQIAKGDGVWERTIRPEQHIPFEEIVWQRVRYRFEWSGGDRAPIEGIESISQILRRPVVHILGQKEYLAGSRAAIRVIVFDAKSNQVQTGSLRINLLIPNQAPVALFAGKLNRRGTIEAGFRFPAGLTGNCMLRFVADTPIGSTETTQSIELKDKASILLTTEKPIYQPGQTIHARALALDRASSQAVAGRKLTFVLEDSRGNKVFRKATETDSFGIASAEFALADEVNLGDYHLRALMGDPEAPANTAELTLDVERYVLPKFKVEIEFPQKDSKPRRDYRPGDHVTGTVRANYFFGKPVARGEVVVKAKGMDVAVFDAAASNGNTDDNGAYRFDLTLPAYFAGRPLSQGAASALIEASVKDSAEHTESRGESITVSQSPLLITAIPEGGTLIPNLENDIFLLSSYPDGTPARATLIVHPPGSTVRTPEQAQDRQLSTDASGIAVLRLNPGAGIRSLRVEADDHRGNRVTATVPLETRGGADQILLRADRAVLKAGDRIQLKVLSTRSRGTAYVDFVRNGQTILTRDLELENGEAELAVDATPEMAGTLDIDAYLFGRDAQPVADHRLVFVQPAEELKIETTADAPAYLPGAEARIRFHVTNERGEGVSAAIGLEAVDEAVFALAEKQPGFAKVFFYLEQELLKPRYEIHSLSMNGVVEDAGEEAAAPQDRAARALFSATETVNPHSLDTEAGRTVPQTRFEEYQQRYQAAFLDQVRQLAEMLDKKISTHSSDNEIVNEFKRLALNGDSPPRDAWNTSLRIEPVRWRWGRDRVFLVRSAGPDRRFDSADDLVVYLRAGSSSVVTQPGQGGSVGLHIEHDRGAVNGQAEVTGTVTDATGAVIPRATVTLQQLSAAGTRTAHANDAGQFSFAGLPAGRYRARIQSPGFMSASSSFSLQPRDRAVLSVTLEVGAVTQAVTVTAAPAAFGVAGMQVMGREMDARAMPAAAGAMFAENFMAEAPADRLMALKKSAAEPSAQAPNEPSSPAAARVRSWFPEALYINPEILTDGHGDASISIPLADSITTWRLAMLASTQSGALGSASASLKVFQDFFVDLDLPVTLTQGDRVSIPVGVYNYSGKAGKVSLKLQPEDWFSLENDAFEKNVSVESGQVGGAQFTLSATRIGKFKLTLSAHMEDAQGANAREDIVVREIEVIPNGREQDLVFNGRLDSRVHHDLAFPAGAIPDATSILVRLYPGPLSQVIEGMDSILSMPGGCFEQTSSSTYPNVLALDYMKRTGKLTPEIHAKAEGYIANGYQRLLTFEVPGGGFSWFGQAPANKILTAYGLMEFSDMSKVSDVDPRLIERTAEWLVSQQQPDGSWKPDTSFINEGATNRYNSDVLRI